MSIVIAVTKGGRTVMAADSLNVFGQERISTDNSKAVKIRRIGPVLFAFTGWSLYDNIVENLLQEHAEPPLNTSNEIFTFFLDLWRHLHDRYQFVNDQCHDKDSPFGDLDASFLIANAAGTSYTVDAIANIDGDANDQLWGYMKPDEAGVVIDGKHGCVLANDAVPTLVATTVGPCSLGSGASIF